MLSLGLSFDVVISSPYVRARQTAEIVADVLGFKDAIEFSESLVPQAKFRDFIKLAKANDSGDKLLCVGHQPNLGRNISALLDGNEGVQIDFKKGSLCRIDLGEDSTSKDFAGFASLHWLLTSKQLRCMA